QAVHSGVAQAFEFNETNRTLAERADEIEVCENLIHKFWHAWLGLEWEGTVDYPDDFSVESLADELDIVLKAKQQVRSPTFKRDLEKKLTRKMMHNASPVDLLTYQLEIDALPELVITGFGPMYFDPSQTPSATPASAEQISQSPLQATAKETAQEAGGKCGTQAKGLLQRSALIRGARTPNAPTTPPRQ